MPDLPTITAATLDQWEASAQADLAADQPWSVHPLAVLAVIGELRAARGEVAAARTALTQIAALCDKADEHRRLNADDNYAYLEPPWVNAASVRALLPTQGETK